MKSSKKNVLHGMTSNFIGLTSLLLMLSLVLVSCDILSNDDTVPTVDDYEPNDERSEAFIIALDTTYDARISDDDDDDWFKITPSHGSDTYDKVQISVTDVSTDLFIHMELYSADGASLATHGNTTKGQSLTYTFATPGVDYYIRLSGWDGIVGDHGSVGSYSLTVSNMDANDEFAPNHTFETAEESLEYGNSYDGVIVSKYETDYYMFSNPASGVWNSYSVTLANVSSDLFATIRFYDVAKNELKSVSSSTKGADLSASLTTKEDVFYVLIAGGNGLFYDDYQSSSGSYSISVVNNGNDDNEPDDTFDDAREITSFPTDLTGTILSDAANDNGGDYEFFKVTIANNKKVSWSVDPDAANTELHFHVYNASQTYLGNEDGGDGQTITGNMSNTTGSDSFIYIKLGGFIGDNGDYSISFTETDAD